MSHEGVFVVTTTEGRAFWLNQDQRPLANFTFDVGFERLLKKEGQTVGSYGLADLPSLAQAKQTADYSPWLNPSACR